MTRTSHRAHATPSFPVYCLGWADDETLIMGGGGGTSRSGIKNKIKSCKVSKDGRNVKYLSEIEFEEGEDTPMSLDIKGKHVVTGVNAPQSSIEAGKNDQCRLLAYSPEEIKAEKSTGTISQTWSDDYPWQKFTAISPGADLVAIGTSQNQVTILRFPDLTEVIHPFQLDSELVDVNWGGSDGLWLAITTVDELQIHRIELGEKPNLQLKQTLYPPSLDISPVSFRAARFSPIASSSRAPTIHAVLNADKPAKRGAPRKAFVVTFGIVAGPSKTPLSPAEKESDSKGKEKAVHDEAEELGRWDVLARREVAGKPITVFDISADGRLLAYGCADLSVGILDSKTLAPLLKILHAHSFPPTALRFNPSANLLVSASADHTIRAIVVPASFDGMSATMIAVFVALLMVILALLLRHT